MNLRKYSEQQLRNAIKESSSKREVLQRLGLVAAGGNYDVLRRAIEFFVIDISHFKSSWNEGREFAYKRDIHDYLTDSGEIQTQSNKLKKRLVNEQILEHKCNKCKNTEWLSAPIPLELHHIDGNKQNNLLINLELICPNCHAQTPNYRGKNIGAVGLEPTM